jgi:N-acyl-D-amino-acid deacylase
MFMHVCWGVAVLLTSPNDTVEADYVIQNVTLHDGSGGEARTGDVAIQGERLVAIGKVQPAGHPRRIDGTGLIAAPGFIDVHTHCDDGLTKAPTRLNKNYLTQGVTTVVTGNCGDGPLDVADYLRKIDASGAGTNVAHLVPHGAVRRKAMGTAKRPPTPAELDRMRQLVDAGMRAGAWGLSTGLIYTPGSYAEADELVELSRVVGQHRGLYVSHMRSEGERLLEAVQETLAIGRRAGVPVHISHFKASGRQAWGKAAEAVRLVQAARDAGQAVTADQYPYIASSTSLSAMVIPEEFRQQGRLTEALADPQRADDIRQRIARNLDARRGGATLFVAKYAKNQAWQGKDLATLAREQQRPVVELVLEIQQNGGAKMVSFGMQEEDVRMIMQLPFVATASDGGVCVPDSSVPHPRNYGCFPRKIGRYAGELRVLPLTAAIRSATGLPADIFGFPRRGYLREGYVADVVVFDPRTFCDTATYEKPHQYATGVRYLFVNGKLAIDRGEVTGELAGRALRHASSSAGPVTAER